MRRWLLKAGATDLDGLVLEDAPKPEPGTGQVRVRIRACALNYKDQIVLKDLHWRAEGVDIVPISDGAGEIDAVGPDAGDWKVGDAVIAVPFKTWLNGPPPLDRGFGLGAGGSDGLLAEYVVLDIAQLGRAPASLSFAEASTLPVAGVTAWSALYGTNPIGPGSKVLVLGGGGVSLIALVLAHAAGAEVFCTSSDDSKIDRMKKLGAKLGVNYRTTPEWGQAIFEQTGGVDKVVDSVGMLNQSLAAVKPGGEVAVLGLLGSDGAPNPMLLMGKVASIRGVNVGSIQAYEDLAAFVETHKVKPPIDSYFSFEQAKEAYRAQSASSLFGKIIINVA